MRRFLIKKAEPGGSAKLTAARSESSPSPHDLRREQAVDGFWEVYRPQSQDERYPEKGDDEIFQAAQEGWSGNHEEHYPDHCEQYKNKDSYDPDEEQ